MKNIILILLIILSCFASAQQLNKTDSSGNRQGVWKEHYKTGEIKSKAFYIDNMRYGEFVKYTKKGYIKEILYFDKGNLLLYKTYYRCKKYRGQVKRINGLKYDKTISEFMFTSDSSLLKGNWNQRDSFDEKTGKWYESKVMDPLSGGVIFKHYYCVGSYENGLKEGAWLYYHYDGKQLLYKCNYKAGLLDGEIAIYNTKGDLKALYHYVLGKKNGEYIAYYDNGMMSVKATFYDDNFVGEYFKYNKKGKLIKYIKDTSKQFPYDW